MSWSPINFHWGISNKFCNVTEGSKACFASHDTVPTSFKRDMIGEDRVQIRAYNSKGVVCPSRGKWKWRKEWWWNKMKFLPSWWQWLKRHLVSPKTESFHQKSLKRRSLHPWKKQASNLSGWETVSRYDRGESANCTWSWKKLPQKRMARKADSENGIVQACFLKEIIEQHQTAIPAERSRNKKRLTALNRDSKNHAALYTRIDSTNATQRLCCWQHWTETRRNEKPEFARPGSMKGDDRKGRNWESVSYMTAQIDMMVSCFPPFNYLTEFLIANGLSWPVVCTKAKRKCCTNHWKANPSPA